MNCTDGSAGPDHSGVSRTVRSQSAMRGSFALPGAARPSCCAAARRHADGREHQAQRDEREPQQSSSRARGQGSDSCAARVSTARTAAVSVSGRSKPGTSA